MRAKPFFNWAAADLLPGRILLDGLVVFLDCLFELPLLVVDVADVKLGVGSKGGIRIIAEVVCKLL